MIVSPANWKPRPGIAVFWVLVVVSVITLVSAGVVSQTYLARRSTSLHYNQAQSLWLARSGAELAVAKILEEGDKYTGEVVKPVPQSEVAVTVAKDTAGIFRIESRSRFPTDGREAAVGVVRMALRRENGAGGLRIDRVNAE